MSRVRCVCVWEVRWPTSPSGFDCVRLAASVRSSSHKYQCSRGDLSRKPHKGRSAEALTRVSVWGETQGTFQWNAGNPAVIVWLGKLSAQECDLHSLSAVSLPLIVCERGKHRHAYRSNTLGLTVVVLHICNIIAFASQPSKMKQI